MSVDRIAAVEAILAATEAAHGAYEATELHGVYDEAWADWYARYAVDHGIGQALGREVTPDELAALLVRTWEHRTAGEPAPGEGWAGWMARRIVAPA